MSVFAVPNRDPIYRSSVAVRNTHLGTNKIRWHYQRPTRHTVRITKECIGQFRQRRICWIYVFFSNFSSMFLIRVVLSFIFQPIIYDWMNFHRLLTSFSASQYKWQTVAITSTLPLIAPSNASGSIKRRRVLSLIISSAMRFLLYYLQVKFDSHMRPNIGHNHFLFLVNISFLLSCDYLSWKTFLLL